MRLPRRPGHRYRHLLDLAAQHALNGEQTPCAADPGPWLSDDTTERARAADDCHRCPIRAECVAATAEIRPTFGVWGGKDRTSRHDTSTETEAHNPAPQPGREPTQTATRGALRNPATARRAPPGDPAAGQTPSHQPPGRNPTMLIDYEAILDDTKPGPEDPDADRIVADALGIAHHTTTSSGERSIDQVVAEALNRPLPAPRPRPADEADRIISEAL